jgi:uncharacterized membrane protein YbaN (DUF454 family)
VVIVAADPSRRRCTVITLLQELSGPTELHSAQDAKQQQDQRVTSEPIDPQQQGWLARAGWIALGLVAVGIGGLGIIVPGLPSTVFFVVAAWAFSRSSPRLERWLLNLPTIGPLVKDYRAGLGMPREAKATAVLMIVFFGGLSIFIVQGWILRVVILAAGLSGIATILLRVPTKAPEETPSTDD